MSSSTLIPLSEAQTGRIHLSEFKSFLRPDDDLEIWVISNGDGVFEVRCDAAKYPFTVSIIFGQNTHELVFLDRDTPLKTPQMGTCDLNALNLRIPSLAP